MEFYSPLYLASMVAQEGVNQNEELVKKYGALERSFELSQYSVARSPSIIDPN